MKPGNPESGTISEQAAHWLGALMEDGAAEQAEFLAWLRKSPQHVEEFLFATATWTKLRQMGTKAPMDIEKILAEIADAGVRSNVVTMPAASRLPEEGDSLNLPDTVPRRASAGLFRRRAGLAAGLAACGIAGILGWWAIRGGSTYATAIGEQRTVRLTDGSMLYLNATSHARIHFSDRAREIELLDGEALFVVAKDNARPFRVTAGTAVIQALGTQFNVRYLAADTRVSVIEGRVRISGQPSDLSVGAGEEATVGGNGSIAKRKAADVAQAVAWRERRLVFRAERLADVAATINRYGSRHFHVEGEAARNTRLTATFDADDPRSLATFLQRYGELSVEERDGDFVVRERPAQ